MENVKDTSRLSLFHTFQAPPHVRSPFMPTGQVVSTFCEGPKLSPYPILLACISLLPIHKESTRAAQPSVNQHVEIEQRYNRDE